MKIVIVAKTRMGRGACIGALSFKGRSLRLIAADLDNNEQFNMDYQVGEVWDIETKEDPDIIPPHVENVVVLKKQRLAPISGLIKFIGNHMPPIQGGVDVIFDGLTQKTSKGSLYISEKSGIPGRSTMFWQTECPLERVDDEKRIRYRYPSTDGGSTLTFVGFQNPVQEIPAGTILRVSLAHWWRPKEKSNSELRCYVQLSGWFTDDCIQDYCVSNITSDDIKTYEEKVLEINQVLLETFGYSDFRPLQRQIIEKILNKQDVLAVMPTGSGKSLCYQLPALLYNGITVVVSPLISLMEDQVLELMELGIPSVYLNSTLTHDQYLKEVRKIKERNVKLVYAAPETLLRPETMILLEKSLVDCFVIDEAHCISEWGHDFRPDYRQLHELRSRLPHAATLAVTATATERVRNDIKKSLKIPDANQFVSSFDRSNLLLSVVDKINPLSQTLEFLESHKGQAGIIFCATRDHVDSLSEELKSHGYPVLAYHAGMETDERREHQYRFRFEEGIIIVATIAFGMGINKSNVRFILHYDLPKNLENYYQQIGRAGRDGLRADCLMLFSYRDISKIEFFISKENPKHQSGSRKRLNALIAFLDTKTCRRKPLLDYFGEFYEKENCGACDNCTGKRRREIFQSISTAIESVDESLDFPDLTIPARQFLTCMEETGETFGMLHIINVLRGSKAKKIFKFKHDALSTYGLGRSYSLDGWRNLAGKLLGQGLVERSLKHKNLILTEAGKEILNGKKFWGDGETNLSKTIPIKFDPEYNRELFDLLRFRRLELARERKLPPYIIFHDSVLVNMAANYPCTTASFIRIPGVGPHKLEHYGPHFIPIIQNYCKEKGIQPDQIPFTEKRS